MATFQPSPKTLCSPLLLPALAVIALNLGGCGGGGQSSGTNAPATANSIQPSTATSGSTSSSSSTQNSTSSQNSTSASTSPSSPTTTTSSTTTSANTLTSWYHPPLNVSWQIQLQGTLNTGYNVTLYDLDLFDTPQATINDLHAAGHKVICYFSAGTYENWRPDASRFKPSDLGNNLGAWPGESWLDTRSSNVRAIMASRLDLAVQKGCDGVDPDNVDGYTNQPGLPLTYATQLNYNLWLASQAHQRGLAVSLKNDLDQIPDLVSHVDFAINESCNVYNECSLMKPFIAAGKPVLEINYLYASNAAARATLCQSNNSLGLRTLTLPQMLDDSFRFSCNS